MIHRAGPGCSAGEYHRAVAGTGHDDLKAGLRAGCVAATSYPSAFLVYFNALALLINSAAALASANAVKATLRAVKYAIAGTAQRLWPLDQHCREQNFLEVFCERQIALNLRDDPSALQARDDEISYVAGLEILGKLVGLHGSL